MREAYSLGRSLLVVAAGVLLGALLFSAGCASYTAQGLDSPGGSGQGAESWGMAGSIIEAIEEIRSRHADPSGGSRYIVNLPEGTSRDRADQILRGLGGSVMLPEAGRSPGAPVYHIARVWVRGLRTKVDVVYPMAGSGGSAGVGNATVWVRRGPISWWIERVQYWTPGVIPTPALYVPFDESGDGGGAPVRGAEGPGPEGADRGAGPEGGDAGDGRGEDEGLYREVGGG